MRISRFIIVFIVVLGLTGCMGLDKALGLKAEGDAAQTAYDIVVEEMAGLRADFAVLKADDPDAASMIDALIEAWDEKTTEASKLEEVILSTAKKLADADKGWAWAEMLAGAAALAVPGAGIALPIIRRSRRMLEGVIGSMAAGGGPVDGKLANKFMATIPGLKDLVTDHRVAIGDKVRKAVKA